MNFLALPLLAPLVTLLLALPAPLSALTGIAQPAAPPAPAAAVQTLRSVLNRPIERLRHADFRATGRLINIDAAGKRTGYNLALKVLGTPTALHVLLDITQPAKARLHVLLIQRSDGQTTIQMARPGDTAPASLPLDQWSAGLMGGDFSYEDFLETQYFWHQQVLLPPQKYGAHDCNLLESKPVPSDRTRYAMVRTWLDRAIGFPVYVEKTLKGKPAVKQYTYYGLRKTGGVWSATQVEARLRGSPGSTLLVFERGSANAKLDESEFNAVKLTQF